MLDAHTVSGTNLVYSFCLFQNGRISRKYNTIILYIELWVSKLQTHFSPNVLFIGCIIFPQVKVIRLKLMNPDIGDVG